jgi:hypothetical protein
MMNGQDLRQLLYQKWGHSFDLQLRRVQGKVYLQVMWKYLEQASFPLSETDYLAHLDAIALRLAEWQADEHVQLFIAQTRERPRLGKAVNIPINLGERASEWLIEDL